MVKLNNTISLWSEAPIIPNNSIGAISGGGWLFVPESWWSVPTFPENFDISLSTYDSIVDVISWSSLRAFYFAPDWLNHYHIDDGTNLIYQDTLSIAWDLSTASQVHTHNISWVWWWLRWMCFSSDGLNYYAVWSTADSIRQYTLSTAWDLSTSSVNYVKQFVLWYATDGIAMSDDGVYLYITYSNRKIRQFTLSTPYSINTATLTNTTADLLDFPLALHISPDWKSIFYTADNDFVYQFNMSTPYDILTAVYFSRVDVTNSSFVRWLWFKSDYTKMYATSQTSPRLYQYSTNN